MPAFVLEPEFERRFAENPRRAAYVCGAVSSLRAALGEEGGALVIRRGPRAETVVRLAREAAVTAVCWSAAYDAATIAADRGVQGALEEAGFRVTIVHDAPVVPPDETAAARRDDDGAGYRSLASYLAAWRVRPHASYAARPAFVRASESLASEAAPDAPGAELDPPTERGVLASVDAFLAGPALAYRTARNVPAAGPTARLSAALSYGIVSARSVLARIVERGRDPFLLAEEAASLEALVRALGQRDFFLQLGWFFDDPGGGVLQSRMRGFPATKAHAGLDAWLAGRTGFALVDAGMRQLAATGWMHPRVRLVAASFACFDLGLDWRVGRDAWERLLVEDEPALATGNWQWVAGVGADLAQVPRIFDPQRQARWSDPLGEYVRHWIPELAPFAGALAVEPRRVNERGQLSLPLYDETYPQPILDHHVAARTYLKRYGDFLKNREGQGR